MGSLRRSSGFTLIEMMVSLAIVTIIAGVVLTSHSSFSNSLIVSNTAYDVALSMREAQSYGIGVRGLGSTVNVGYGLDFSAATPLSYRFFSDGYGGATCGASAPPNCKPGDGVYSANHDAVVSNYTINNGISIVGFCGYSGGVKYCTSDASADQIDIVFTRPNTTALITALKNLSIVGNNLQSACIALASPAGNRRYISVSLVGEIDLPSSCTGL